MQGPALNVYFSFVYVSIRIWQDAGVMDGGMKDGSSSN